MGRGHKKTRAELDLSLVSLGAISAVPLMREYAILEFRCIGKRQRSTVSRPRCHYLQCFQVGSNSCRELDDS